MFMTEQNGIYFPLLRNVRRSHSRTAGGGIAQAQFKLQLHPSNGGVVITSYTATSNPGGITGTLSQSGMEALP
jgi:carbon monoxide dehydrogenase subunit G